jgi:hypothetical protein
VTTIDILTTPNGREGLYVDGRLVADTWGITPLEDLAAALGLTVRYTDVDLEATAEFEEELT